MKSLIFLPKRIRESLKEIYNHRVTIICAPDGTGKSTLLRAFLRSEKRPNMSVRFISSADSTDECFSEIMKQLARAVRGNGSAKEYTSLSEPLSDAELAAALFEFRKCSYNDMTIVVDCPPAVQTVFGNYRCAEFFSKLSSTVHIVLVGETLKPAYRDLAKHFGFFVPERDLFRINVREIKEYSRKAGFFDGSLRLPLPDFGAIYSASHGSVMDTRLCFMLAERGESFSNLTSEERLMKAVVRRLSKRAQCALIVAASTRKSGKLSEELCGDLRLFSSITEYFGEGQYTPLNIDAILSEMSRINDIMELATINRKKRSVRLHPILKRTAYSLFFTFPQNVRHDLRICFAREHRLCGDAFSCFCEYALAEEYESAGEIRPRGLISYTMMTGCKKIITSFVRGCPPECNAALPRLLRMTALLMHTDAKPIVEDKFDEIIDYLKSNCTKPDVRQSLCYAYALKSHKNMYSLDKMGADIMRAYELFEDDEERQNAFRKKYEPPVFPWSMGAPSVLALVHRRGESLKIEAVKFARYQGMYSEILGHGKYMQNIFAGEVKYYQGNIEEGLEILSATANYASDSIEFKMSAFYNAAKCCMVLGDYIGFFDYLNRLISVERDTAVADESSIARLYIGMLGAMRGSGIEDSWLALSVDESDPIYNAYTAPYFIMTKAAFFLADGQSERLAQCSDRYIAAVDTAGNETASIKLRLYCAQAFLSVGSVKHSARLFSDAIYECEDNDMPAVAAEVCAAYPEMFEILKPSEESGLYNDEYLDLETLSQAIDKIQVMGRKFRRGIETVRTYEITYLSSKSRSDHVEHYLSSLKELVLETDEIRAKLGLTNTAYSYAIVAASGAENAEISRLFGVSIDSVKSSLKRTCAAVGAKNRHALREFIPRLK